MCLTCFRQRVSYAYRMRSYAYDQSVLEIGKRVFGTDTNDSRRKTRGVRAFATSSRRARPRRRTAAMRSSSGARDTSPRSTRARSETLRRRSTRTEVVAHVARPSHAENGQVPAQVAGVAQLAALQARLEHLAVRARARSRRQPGSTTRRRTARVCGAREARGALPRQRVAVMFSRPTFVSPESND